MHYKWRLWRSMKTSKCWCQGESVGAFPGDNIIIEVCLKSIEYVLVINVKFSRIIKSTLTVDQVKLAHWLGRAQPLTWYPKWALVHDILGPSKSISFSINRRLDLMLKVNLSSSCFGILWARVLIVIVITELIQGFVFIIRILFIVRVFGLPNIVDC